MASSSKEYVELNLQPALAAGLVALCRARPADPVTWLAEWLIANKPPPKLQEPGTGAAVQAVIDAYKTPEGKAALKELWTSLDVNGDGTISSKEWGKGVKANWKSMATFFGGMTKEEVGKAFKRLDTDGSGDLTWEEFEAALQGADAAVALAHAMETIEGAKELKSLFETLDKDGDGKVTGKEWGQALSKNHELMSKYFGGKNKKAVGKAFKRIDADGSGDLTWDEFVAGSQRVIAAL